MQAGLCLGQFSGYTGCSWFVRNIFRFLHSLYLVLRTIQSDLPFTNVRSVIVSCVHMLLLLIDCNICFELFPKNVDGRHLLLLFASLSHIYFIYQTRGSPLMFVEKSQF